MPRRPAKVTQADIARSVRAAKQAGAGTVEVRPDGTIVISIATSLPVEIVTSDDEAAAIVL